jgi:hypothetical protein
MDTAEPEKKESNTLAIISLVLGLISLIPAYLLLNVYLTEEDSGLGFKFFTELIYFALGALPGSLAVVTGGMTLVHFKKYSRLGKVLASIGLSSGGIIFLPLLVLFLELIWYYAFGRLLFGRLG